MPRRPERGRRGGTSRARAAAPPAERITAGGRPGGTRIAAVGAVILFAVFLKPLPTLADSFRCGLSIVKTGDSFVEVLDKCGPPLAKVGSVEEVRSGRRTTYIGVEQWIYNTGKRRLRRILVFRNGFLDEVLVGSRQD